MATGTVKFFHNRKGYGFIETPASDDDVFFHMDDIDDGKPREGQEVEFEIEQAEKGPRATNIQILEDGVNPW